MQFRAFVLGFLFAGTAGFCFAQFPTMGQSGTPYPGYSGPNGQIGQTGQGGLSSSMRNLNSIIGSVRTSDNQPLNNISVELRDGNTGTVVGSSYTANGGTFEFRQLQQGSYEVVAASGTSRVEEEVQVISANTNVDLRMPVNKTPHDGIEGPIVSVTQYHVPEAAREELRKAQEAASKSKVDEAVKHLDRALEIQPTYSEALALRAAFKLDNRDIPGAMGDAQKAIENDGNYALAYTVMGSAQNVQMRFDEALRSLQRAESLAPGVWQTYFELGRAYAGKRDFTTALRSLERAQSLAPPSYPLIQLVRAYCLMQLGRNSEAVNELQAYLSKNPTGSRAEDAKKMLARAQAAMGSTSN